MLFGLNLRLALGIRVSSVVKVRVMDMFRFKIRFYNFMAVPGSDHCSAASRTRFMRKNANLPTYR